MKKLIAVIVLIAVIGVTIGIVATRTKPEAGTRESTAMSVSEPAQEQKTQITSSEQKQLVSVSMSISPTVVK